MSRIRLSKLTAAAREIVIAEGQEMGEFAEISGETLTRVLTAQKESSTSERDWPIWALVAAFFSAPTDRGIGDTIRREVGSAKTERFKRWHEATFGVWAAPCGCGKTASLNTLYPYDDTARNRRADRGEIGAVFGVSAPHVRHVREARELESLPEV